MKRSQAPDEDFEEETRTEDDSYHELTDDAGPKKIKLTEKLDTALLGYLSKAEVKDSNYHFCMGIAENLRKLTDAQASYAKVRI
jgi:hypothetical protein